MMLKRPKQEAVGSSIKRDISEKQPIPIKLDVRTKSMKGRNTRLKEPRDPRYAAKR